MATAPAVLYDQFSRPVRPHARTFHHGAGSGRRFAGTLGSNAAATTVVLSDAQRLWARSRDLFRNNPWAISGRRSYVANAIGTGLRPQSLAPPGEFRDAITALWPLWVAEADADGNYDFYGLQTLGVNGVVESGEVFARHRIRRASDGLAVPLQIQMLEPDHVPIHRTQQLAEGNTIRGGIEFDQLGRKVAYWVFRVHPGDHSQLGVNRQEVRIPAESISHMFMKQRPGQIRGEPWLKSVLLRLLELDKFEDAELVRKGTAALFAAFVMTKGDGTSPILFESNAERAPLSLEPGIIQRMDPGEEIVFSTPADVGPNFDAFTSLNLRGIARGVGVTFEQLTGDLRNVNFSAIRAVRIEFQRELLQFVTNTVVFQFCQPIWAAFVREAILSGAAPMPEGFAQNPRLWLRAKWIHPQIEYVRPLEQVKTTKEKISGGLQTMTNAQEELNNDPAAMMEEYAAERLRAAELELVFDTDEGRKFPQEEESNGQR